MRTLRSAWNLHCPASPTTAIFPLLSVVMPSSLASFLPALAAPILSSMMQGYASWTTILLVALSSSKTFNSSHYLQNQIPTAEPAVQSLRDLATSYMLSFVYNTHS